MGGASGALKSFVFVLGNRFRCSEWFKILLIIVPFWEISESYKQKRSNTQA